MKKEKRQNIGIKESIHTLAKVYCAGNKIKLNIFVENLIIDKLNKEK